MSSQEAQSTDRLSTNGAVRAPGSLAALNGHAGPAPGAGGSSAGGGNGHPAAKPGDLPALEPKAAAVITAQDAVRLRAVPIRSENGRLLVAMIDTADFAAADELSILAAQPVDRAAVTPELFDTLLRNAFGATAAQMAARLAGAAGA